MGKTKTTKAISLLISIIVCCLALQDIQDWSAVGIFTGCGPGCRLSYPFCHANMIHAALNAWCLLSVVFVYKVSLLRLAFAYMAAVSVPAFCLSSVPTVGLSGLVFALFGSISFEVGRKVYYQLWMLAYLASGFLFPCTNAWVHLYCYFAGCLIALLNKPVKVS